MRTLMLSYFPPMRGGISAYAAQAVSAMRARGDDVMVASPVASSADHVIDLSQRGSGRALARLAASQDLLVVQFQPEMLGPGDASRLSRFRSLFRLAQALRAAPRSELRLHEVDYGAGLQAPLIRRILRPIWNLADVLVVHTEREKRDFAAAFGIDSAKIEVGSQGDNLIRWIDGDRSAARAALGIDPSGPVLLAIGFLQPNKGFDRALHAFAAVASKQSHLYVVGAGWRDDEIGAEHLELLRDLAAKTPRAELREGYLSDEDFDRWIVASDVLVLPYRAGWSSNVMERGLLYERPVIMSRVGGMEEQAVDRDEVTLVSDDRELVDALRRHA